MLLPAGLLHHLRNGCPFFAVQKVDHLIQLATRSGFGLCLGWSLNRLGLLYANSLSPGWSQGVINPAAIAVDGLNQLLVQQAIENLFRSAALNRQILCGKGAFVMTQFQGVGLAG